MTHQAKTNAGFIAWSMDRSIGKDPDKECPECESKNVVPHCKGTFTPDGKICLDCLTIFGREKDGSREKI